jgi:type III restriction enzyme
VQRKIGLKAVYDLSATPFFLRGSGWPEGTLFPWVVSDFSLIDAIESGIVKVPRVPVDDNQMSGTLPTYRALWEKIRDGLPRKGRGTEAVEGEPVLPKELEGALHALYGNYEQYHRKWEADAEGRAGGRTPPVFIVVCNNTNVSKLIFDYIAGWEKPVLEGTPVLVNGKLCLFSNVVDGRWSARPTTILVDSEQLESGEAMSAEFKRIAAAEIAEFKEEYRQRFPGRDPDELTDEDLLREVMNTVGKLDRLGEQVKCVISVSMLTEGWDANTVTHIVGVRAFGTQLLCEQVVGRGLRRTNYAVGEDGRFAPEYAEVYGVPFSFIPCSGSTGAPPRPVLATRVRALEERSALEIRFPRLSGYRYDLGEERIEAHFGDESRFVLSTEEIPTKVEVAPIIGEHHFDTLDDLKKKRDQEVIFLLAKLVLERFFRDDERNLKPWLFPQLLRITTRWYEECVTCKDNTFKQLLYFMQFALEAADRIYRGIVAAEAGTHRLLPILLPYDPWATTAFVDFDTTRSVYETRADRCHVSHIVADTKSWEQKLAQTLEEMPEVTSYVKNDRQPGFAIPYTFEGSQHQYYPDFVARVDDGHGTGDLLSLLIEVTGEKKKEKESKVATARTLWVPAVNNHGGLGRWAFVEVSDPYNCQTQLRAAIQAAATQSPAPTAS